MGEVSIDRAKNSKSVIDNPQAIEQLLSEELALGRFRGPFDDPPFARFHTSPLSLKPKKDPGKFRLVIDLSYPYDNTSVNKNIPDEIASVKYTSFEQAIDLLLQSGPFSSMAKADIKSAFRIIPVHPDDYRYLGFTVQGKYYYDVNLPMGCSISCAVFEAFARALHWILEHKLGIINVLHYLDDWFFVEKSDKDCEYDLHIFKHITTKLGVPLAPEKLEGPSKVLSFLGIELDSIQMEARIPQNKLQKYRTALDNIIQSDSVPMGELRSLAGKLNWTLSIIPSGRAFLRRLYDAFSHIDDPRLMIPINSGLQQDLKTWQTFLNEYNGRHFLAYYPIRDATELNLHADASFKAGAATFKDEWIRILFPADWSKFGITFLELYPLIAMLDLKAAVLKNSKVILHTDNHAAMVIINAQTAKPPHIMRLVRYMVLLTLRYSIKVVAKHVPGKLNCIPDLLSRLQDTPQMLAEAGLRSKPTSLKSRWDPISWTQQAGTY